MTTSKPTAPCAICAACGIRTMTTARSAWTVDGGVRVPCAERPVCRECQRQAAHYPTEAEAQSSAAVTLGRKGGKAGTPAQLAQRRAAAVKGGRPGPAHIAVIQPTLSVGEAGWEDSGTVISRHRSVEAAQSAIDNAHAALRRQPGAGQSWYDWHIVRVGADGTRGPVETRDDEDECPYCYTVGGGHTYGCSQARR